MKISERTLKDRLARASKDELAISKKIMQALGARDINFSRLDRLHVEYRAAIKRIAAAETELHRHRTTLRLAEFVRSIFAPSPSTTATA